MPEKTKSCNYPKTFLQGTCISYGQWPARNPTLEHKNRLEDRRSSARELVLRTHKHAERKKANLNSREVHEITRFWICRLCVSTFLLYFSLESIHLYYFNIIKKYTSHIYDQTEEIKIKREVKHRPRIEKKIISWLWTNIKLWTN